MSFSNIQTRGRPLTIKDEGVSLNTDVASIDFTGGGVSGSAVGQDITEAIASGMNKETPVGDIDGSNTIFTVSNAPSFLIVNGQLQTEEANDYALSGGDLTITFTTAPPTTSTLVSYH